MYLNNMLGLITMKIEILESSQENQRLELANIVLKAAIILNIIKINY